MKRTPAWCALLFLITLSLLSSAAVQDLENRLAGIKTKISGEEQINRELKAQLSDKEAAVAEAQHRLKQLEEQIAAFRKKHQLESK